MALQSGDNWRRRRANREQALLQLTESWTNGKRCQSSSSVPQIRVPLTQFERRQADREERLAEGPGSRVN